MRIYLLAMATTLLISSCASYSPVQHIGGERHQSAAALESCSFDILTFPVDPKNTSIAGECARSISMPLRSTASNTPIGCTYGLS